MASELIARRISLKQRTFHTSISHLRIKHKDGEKKENSREYNNSQKRSLTYKKKEEKHNRRHKRTNPI